ncbi:MAG TPA: hypothetical protein VFZ63_19780 [Jiangellaceae bacterium]
MDAGRRTAWRRALIVISIGHLLLMSPNSTTATPDFDSEIADDTISVQGEASNVEQTGNAPDQSGQSNGGDAPTGPIVQSRWVPDCVDSSPYEEVMCGTALTCPENVGLAEPTHVRVRQYQREVDRETGDPLTEWQHVGTQCRTVEELAEAQAEQAEGPSLLQLVIREWETIQIPAATIGINPPEGRTLVNFETIFFTDPGEQSFPMTLLGRSIVIYAIPIEYTWHHGDGTSQTTQSPGAPYPSKDVTHQFDTIGTVNPRVDIRYRAEFTVDGGARQPIPGIASVTGTSEELTILEARTRLVDG